MRWLVGTLWIGLVAGGWAWASPAGACGWVPSLELAEPADGATDVPTNVVPWLWGKLGSEPFTITLRDSEGTAAPADVEPLRGYVISDFVEVRPREPLRVGTQYELELVVRETVSVYAFTTGDGALDGEPGALGALAMQVADNAYMSSCGDNTFTCVARPADVTLHATVVSAGETEAELLWQWPGAVRYARTAPSLDRPFCIELRARNLAGALGPPSEVCSDGSPRYDVATTSPITCEGSRVATEDGFADGLPPPDPAVGDAGPGGPAGRDAGGGGGGGCAASPGRGDGWLALAVLLGLALRRGRARV